MVSCAPSRTATSRPWPSVGPWLSSRSSWWGRSSSGGWPTPCPEAQSPTPSGCWAGRASPSLPSSRSRPSSGQAGPTGTSNPIRERIGGAVRLARGRPPGHPDVGRLLLVPRPVGPLDLDETATFVEPPGPEVGHEDPQLVAVGMGRLDDVEQEGADALALEVRADVEGVEERRSCRSRSRGARRRPRPPRPCARRPRRRGDGSSRGAPRRCAWPAASAARRPAGRRSRGRPGPPTRRAVPRGR